MFLIAGCIWTASPGTAGAADQQESSRRAVARDREMRFREMDRDNDGVITRAEWTGTAQAFRDQDRNRDGVLSGNEIWMARGRSVMETEFSRADTNHDGALSPAEWWGDRATFERIDRNNDGVIGPTEFVGEESGEALPSDRASFASLDRNGNGVITRGEWNGRADDFRAFDTDNDGVLTQREYRQGGTVVDSSAYRAGHDRGLADGRQAGREDKQINGGKWDLDGQRELETADAGYNVGMGTRTDYQAGYRAGFRSGYREGFGPR
jgi:Ca2+-binding EF-hand superfamily protein